MGSISWLLMTLVLVLVVAFKAWQRIKRRFKSAFQHGRDAKHPHIVNSFKAIDTVVATERCHCGGGLVGLGESTVVVGARELRVVRTECRRCEEEHRLFFDLSQIYH